MILVAAILASCSKSQEPAQTQTLDSASQDTIEDVAEISQDVTEVYESAEVTASSDATATN